jgi:copper transport protein
VQSDPRPGATLGASPTAVRLSFTERPEPRLSEIRVVDTSGRSHARGRPAAVAGDPLALSVPVGPLRRGVYTVAWRIVSAVDGHATAGAYAFGVGVPPGPGAAVAPTANPRTSVLEVLARWLFLGGLLALLGGAAARLARFGDDRILAPAAWAVAALGLLLLAEAQRRGADASLADLLGTTVGHALVWRGVALAVAGGALVAARRPRLRRASRLVVAAGALAALGVHVAAGHAAAGTWPHVVTVLAQWAHVAAAGIWLGGLAALLLGVRGAASAAKAVAVRRFSSLAAVGLVVVAATGLLRAVDELESPGELASTGYGRAVIAKSALLLGIAALGLLNRRRSVPAAAVSLRPLRTTSGVELGLAVCALAAAALLGALAPPAGRAQPIGLSVSGADTATSVRVRLTAASAEPGPNSFLVRAVDYDSRDPVRARRVELRFVALDDPGVPATSLPLGRRADGSYEGSGANLAFDGRWRVTVVLERARDAVAVPLDLDVRGPAQFVSVERRPGRPPAYSVDVDGLNTIRFSPDPERPGASLLLVTCFDALGAELQVDSLVVTLAGADGVGAQQPVRRLGRGRFAGGIHLPAGPVTLAAVARKRDGTRLRATIRIDVPA